MFHPLKFSVGRIYRNESLRPETFLGGDSIARHRPFPAVSAESRPSVLNCDDAVISWRRLPVPVSVRLPVLLRLSLCRHPILRCDEMHDGKPLSSPAMGHCVTCPPPQTFNMFNFSGHFRAAQTLDTGLSVVAYTQKKYTWPGRL